MAVRIRIKGASIECTDLSIPKILLRQPSISVWYVESKLVDGIIQLYDSDGNKRIRANYELIYLSNAIDSDNMPFTESSFRSFAQNNLSGGTPSTAETFIQRILSLSGGIIYNNICA